MFFNKKFQYLTSCPCNFRSEVVSDSHHIPSYTTPYLFLHIFKVLAATQLTRQNSQVFMTISDHTSAATLRISGRLRYASILTAWKAPICSSHSCPYPSQSPLQEIQTDKLLGSSRRVISLDDEGIRTTGHILPDPNTASILHGQDRHHYSLPRCGCQEYGHLPTQSLLASDFSLLWRALMLCQSHCSCRHVSKSHLQSLATEKKKQHALATEWIGSNTHCRSQ